MTERVADDFVRHHPGMPRAGQSQQAVSTTDGLVHPSARFHLAFLQPRRAAFSSVGIPLTRSHERLEAGHYGTTERVCY